MKKRHRGIAKWVEDTGMVRYPGQPAHINPPLNSPSHNHTCPLCSSPATITDWVSTYFLDPTSSQWYHHEVRVGRCSSCKIDNDFDRSLAVKIRHGFKRPYVWTESKGLRAVERPQI